jgi:hypothetical protein
MVALMGLALIGGHTGVTLLFAFCSFAALREFVTLTNTRRADHWALEAAFFTALRNFAVSIPMKASGAGRTLRNALEVDAGGSSGLCRIGHGPWVHIRAVTMAMASACGRCAGNDSLIRLLSSSTRQAFFTNVERIVCSETHRVQQPIGAHVQERAELVGSRGLVGARVELHVPCVRAVESRRGAVAGSADQRPVSPPPLIEPVGRQPPEPD